MSLFDDTTVAINQLHAPITNFMFDCSGTQITNGTKA